MTLDSFPRLAPTPRAIAPVLLCSLALACLFGAGARALADAPELPARCPNGAGQEAEPAGYQMAVSDAVADHDAGRFLDARAQFLRAHSLHPSARTLRALGMVEFELRRYVESVGYLEAALACDVRPLAERMRVEAERLLARARAYVGELQLEVTPEPVQVTLDGAPQALVDGRLILAVGPHTIAFAAPGYRASERLLTIVGGESRRLHVALEPERPPAVPLLTVQRDVLSDAAPPAPVAPPSRRRRVLLWTGLGALVAAGLVTGLVVGLRRADERDAEPARTGHEVTGEVLSTLLRGP